MAQLDWVEPAGVAVNQDPGFRKLGSTDLVLGLKSGRAVRVVVFEAFEVAGVRVADEAALRDCEVVIEMTPRQWTDYLAHRARGIGSSLVGLDLDHGILRAADPLLRLKFDRHHLSIQALCDAGARIEAGQRTRGLAGGRRRGFAGGGAKQASAQRSASCRMPVYEYRCADCGVVTSTLASLKAIPEKVECCCGGSAARIVSKPSVHLSKGSKVARLDPKYDAMVDKAMRDTPTADPDRLINRRGDIATGRTDP